MTVAATFGPGADVLDRWAPSVARRSRRFAPASLASPTALVDRDVEDTARRRSLGAVGEYTDMPWLQARIDHLLSLEPNWDSYGARRVAWESALTAASLVAGLVEQGIAAPDVMPTVDGGISIEWHRPQWEFVLEVAQASPIAAYFYDSATNEEWEEADATAAMASVDAVLRRLVREQD